MLSEKTRIVFDYLKEIGPDAKVTAQDIADALGMAKKSVDGIVTSGLQRKGLSVRTPAKVADEEGKAKDVKFISLTEKGLAFDPDADEE